jgi:NAD+ synthase (glutamine-hydrolysing)
MPNHQPLAALVKMTVRDRIVVLHTASPADTARLEQDCYEAYNIQVSGLMQRLRAAGLKKVVIGISGGLDSTQALIVCAQAFDQLGLPRSNILAYTMPGFATSDYTKGNAWDLMRALGVTAAELDIRPAAIQMLGDIGHPYADGTSQYDITFENVQAGLRTDYLFRIANQRGGIVLGTGDKTIAGHLEPGTEVFTYVVVTVGVLSGVDLSRVEDKGYR